MPRFVAVSVELLDPAYRIAAVSEPACRKYAWIDLIGQARWRDGSGLKRGEVDASVRFLARRWGWSVKKTHSFLVALEREGRIVRGKREREHLGKHSPKRITIVNYDRYQTPGNATGNTSGNAKGNKEVPVPCTTTPPSPSLVPRSPSGVPPSVELVTKEVEGSVVGGDSTNEQTELLPEQIFLTPANVASAMTVRWVDEQAVKPPDPEIKKQYRAFLAVAKAHEVIVIAQAWRGMAEVFPYSRGDPWDAFDFRKHFGKAYQLGAEISGTNDRSLAEWLRRFG